MVNTFLVDRDFKKSAQLLDSRRLGKQRVEAYQILNLIENIRILSTQSGIRCVSDFQTFVRELKKWYASRHFVYILCGDYLIETNDKSPTIGKDERVIKMGFCNHPIVEMWFGYEDALKEYINAHIEEWIHRGYKNTMKRYEVNAKIYPEWCEWDYFHENHKSALLAKELDRNEKPWYQFKKEFLEINPFQDYIWVKNHIQYE